MARKVAACVDASPRLKKGHPARARDEDSGPLVLWPMAKAAGLATPLRGTYAPLGSRGLRPPRPLGGIASDIKGILARAFLRVTL